MKIKLLLGAFLILIFSIQLNAQDVHFTQYNESPILLNPANTGFFKGMYRFTGVFRNQWDYRFINNNNIAARNTGYTTFAGGYDMSFKGSKESKDMIGMGLYFLNDRAGEVALSTTYGQLAVSYWKSISNLKNRYVTGGLVLGFVQRRIDYTNLQLPDQYNPLDPFNPLPVVNAPVLNNYIYADFGLGVKYFCQINKRKFVNYGIAVSHVNQPKNSFFFGLPSDQLYRKLTAHFGMKYPLNKTIDILPSLMVLYQGKSMEINEGAYLRFQLTENKAKELMAFNLGLWFRQANRTGGILQDAVNIATKLEYNQYTLGLSYDLNVSKLTTTTKLKGGVELTLSYHGLLDASLGNKRHPVCPVF
jgi:type IX secretion system PorP/SprF family membrane protein